MQTILNAEDKELLLEEKGTDNSVENKTKTEIDRCEPIEELKFPQEYESDFSIVNILDTSNEKELIDLRIKTMFKRSRDNNIYIFTTSQDSYEFPKRTLRANGKLYHFFKPYHYRDVRKFCEDQTSIDRTHEFE